MSEQKGKSPRKTQQEQLDELLDEMNQLNTDVKNLKKNLHEIHRKVLPDLDRLGLDDLFQQLIGAVGFVFPLLFTEEIWKLAESISIQRAFFLIGLTILLGYVFVGRSRLGNMAEQNLVGIPLRLITVLFIAYGATLIIIYVYGLQAYYQLTPATYFKSIAVFGTFSVIGAIAVDMLG
ncbi:MAG: DUF2391 family protein [Calditrichaeota bacterium]|nr:DUF2391 family protein [Calditrichota bacterium]